MAVAITADLQASWPPRVLVSVTGLTVGDTVILYRSVAGERTEVRAGYVLSAADTSFLRIDAELAFGVATTYVAVVNGVDTYSTTPATYALSGGKVALSDAISGLVAEVIILGYGEPSRNSGASVFDVGGRNVVVSRGATGFGGFSTTLDLITESAEQRVALRALLKGATEGIIQVRQPGGYEDIDAYLAVTGSTERWLLPSNSQSPRRGWSLDAVEVEPWAPALEARGYTLQDIADRYDLPGPILNTNPYFETDASGWLVNSGGAIARSTAQAHEGVASLLFTPDGVAATAEVRSASVPGVVVGQTYEASPWVRCAVARNANANIVWRDGASVFLGSAGSVSVPVAAGTWTPIEVSGEAPASAAQAQISVSMGSTPLVSHTLHIDEAILRGAVPDLGELSDDFATLLDIAQADWS